MHNDVPTWPFVFKTLFFIVRDDVTVSVNVPIDLTDDEANDLGDAIKRQAVKTSDCEGMRRYKT